MALSFSCLKLIEEAAIPALTRRESCCVLGFPEVGAITTEQLSDLFKAPVAEPSFESAMRAIGFPKQTVLDVSEYEGADIIADLNVPLRKDTPKFDFVIDNGTVEHCFNVGQAMLNVANLCNVGGVIFHNNPANWFGHGFWNMSPCVYFDFYRANGFEVRVFLRDVGTGISSELEYKPRVTTILAERRYIIHAVAKRISHSPLIFPIQGWYGSSHEEARVSASQARARSQSSMETRSAYIPSFLSSIYQKYF